MQACDAKRQTASAHQQQCALPHSKRCASTPRDTSNPKRVAAGVYFGIPGSLLVPEDQATGQLIEFGESQTILDRIKKSHVPDFNGFKLLDVVPL